MVDNCPIEDCKCEVIVSYELYDCRGMGTGYKCNDCGYVIKEEFPLRSYEGSLQL